MTNNYYAHYVCVCVANQCKREQVIDFDKIMLCLLVYLFYVFSFCFVSLIVFSKVTCMCTMNNGIHVHVVHQHVYV